MTSDDPAASGDVYFEFAAIGRNVKVTAIHGASGIEVSVVAPVTAARSDLQQLALRKLRARLQRDGH